MTEWSIIILNKLTWRFSLFVNEYIEIHLYRIFLGFSGKYQVSSFEIMREMVFVSYTEIQFGPQTISQSLTSDDYPERGFFPLALLLQMEISFPCCQAVSAKGCILAGAACRQLLVRRNLQV